MGILCLNCCQTNKTNNSIQEALSNTDYSERNKDSNRELKANMNEVTKINKNTNDNSDDEFKDYNSSDHIKPFIKSTNDFKTYQIDDQIPIKSQFFVNQNMSNPAESYERVAYLGEGGFSQVLKVKHKQTGGLRAMKVIKKNTHKKEDETSIYDEVNILKTLDHPNIMKIYEFFQDNVNWYLITEYCEYGNLFENFKDIDNKTNPFFTEGVICCIMKQLFSAITFLHAQNIIHGDLKLENILIDNFNLINKFSSKSKVNSTIVDIKLIDFGSSRFFRKKYIVSDTINGTINYVAPEAIHGVLDKKNDIWSCGIIMYLLLSGDFPFFGESDEHTLELIEKGAYQIDTNNAFKNISIEAKDLIKQLLVLDHSKRIDAKTALKHKWFKLKLEVDEIDKNYKVEIMNNIKHFKTEHKFQEAVFTYITHNLIAKDEIEILRKVFQQLDEDGNGRISKEELQKGFKHIIGSVLGDLEIQTLMKNIDNDNNGFIEYEEFLKAALGNNSLLTNENLLQAFNKFDIDKNGTISTDEIRNIIGGDKGIDDENFKAFLTEIDLKEGDTMGLDQFRYLMKKVQRSHTCHNLERVSKTKVTSYKN